MDAVANPLPSPHGPRSPAARTRRSPYRRTPGRPPTHGGAMLTRVLRGVRLDTIDKRSQVGVAIRRVYDDLVNQLGGPDVVTPAEALLLEAVAKKAVIVRAVGEYVLRQELPVQDGRLFEVVLQHDRLQTSLAALL